MGKESLHPVFIASVTSFRRLLRTAVFFSVGFLALFAQVGRADDALNYFKNYFVTGDYVVGGVGLRGTGVYSSSLGGSFATGTINIGGTGPNGSNPVPVTNGVPAGIVAAFLYWQTDEPVSATTPSATKGFFDGNPIVGAVLGNPQNPACDASSSAWWGRVYRADVLRYLAIDPVNNVRRANYPHTVSLPDKAGTGPFTNGASLVVIYRVVVPGNPLVVPLNSVVIYDGAYTLGKRSGKLEQEIAGFYQAYQTSSPSSPVPTMMTPIVGNGQPGFVENLNVTNALRPGSFSKPFTGTAGGRWDNPTFNIYLKANEDSYSFHVTSASDVCLTWGALVTSTPVVDTDHDGLLDVWETKGLHLNNQTSPATFGGCSDYPSDSCVNLPAMGASPTKPDIFVEIDWLRGDGHLHIPKYAALNAVGTTFGNHGIAMHFDVGSNYKGSPFIVPAAYARGGEVIEESTLLCPNTKTPASLCAFSEPYAVLSWKRGFHAVKDGFRVLGINPHFDHSRKDIFHYVLFAHALAGPFDPTGKPLSKDPKSVSGVADRPGGDLMITLGLWRYDDLPGCDPTVNCADQTGTALVQAGGLMHELGHNLDLSHAGLYRVPNCMPNYPSVMNYLYQSRGLTGSDNKEHIDYSNGLLKPLDEASLPEAPGALGTLAYRVRFYGPPILPGEGTAKLHCDGTSIGNGSAVRLETPGLSTPDWNRNGKLDGPNLFDVNFSGLLQDGVAGRKVFVDSNDWSSLNLQQIGARPNVNGLSADVGEADLGEADLGEADLGEADLGEADLGEADLGEADLGEADLGDVDYDTVIATLDATASDQPLTAANKIDRITLNWGAPSIGQIRRYNIYRSDPAHANPVFLNQVDGAPPVTTYDDQVNDFVNAGAACSGNKTCYNTTYTYYVTSTDIIGTDSSASNSATSEVTHLFVIADNQTVVYGDANPSGSSLTFKIYGDVPGTLTSGVSCGYMSVPRNVGSYAIICTGPDKTSSTDGVTYNSPYNDGIAHTPGALSITPRALTITAVSNTKTYDATTGAAATPTVSGLQGGDTVTGLAETYDTANAGTGKTLSVSAYTVNDGNGGNNYTVTTKSDTTGVINKAAAIINVIPYSVTYDGAAHMATGTAKGVLAESLSGLDLSGTTHTNAGTYNGDPWSFSGGTNYNDAAGTVNDSIARAATTTVIISDTPDPSIVGQPVTITFTVTVTPPGGGTPTGTVTVSDGAGASCSAAIAAGTCSLTPTVAGNKTLTAIYAGDGNFVGSAGTAAHQVIQPVANGGFETGTLAGWNVEAGSVADVRTTLGPSGTYTPLLPPQGAYMAFLSTAGTANTPPGTYGSVISQSFTAPSIPSRISFCYQYVSNDSHEFENFFLAQLITGAGTFVLGSADNAGGSPAGGSFAPPPPTVSVGVTLNPSVAPVFFSGVNILGGDFYLIDSSLMTARVCSSFALPTAVQGTQVTLRFTTGDVGDEVFDSAVVVDDVKVMPQ